MASAVRLSVERRSNDTNMKLVKRFIKKAQQAGIVDEARDRMYFTGTRRTKKRKNKRF